MRKDVHYFGLDCLRLLAASLVVLDHFGLYGWATPSATLPDAERAFPFLHGMGNIGSIGVEIFFLISGFVIAASAKGASASQFITNRAIRVFPALWICGVVALVARATTGEPIGLLVHDFLRSAFLSPAGPYIDGVVWTLVVEAVFYLLIFLVLLRGAFGRIDAIAKGLGVVSACFIAIMVAAILGAHLAGANAAPRLASLAALCDRFPTKVFLLRHGVFFALGILVWSGFDSGFTRSRVAFGALFALFCTIEIGINRGAPSEFLIPIVVWWAGFLAIIVSLAKAAWIHARLSRRARLVKDMGRLSYPLYLNHYTLGIVLVPALAGLGLQRMPVLALSLAIVFVTSALIMRFPERIAQAFLRDKLAGMLKRGAAPAVARGPAPFYFR